MGGKGKSSGNYYQEPPDKSGYGTLDEAEKTLAATKPIDMSGYQENINVKKAAADATAKKPVIPAAEQLPQEGESSTVTEDGAGETAKKAVLSPPTFWAQYGQAPQPLFANNTEPTTNTTQI